VRFEGCLAMEATPRCRRAPESDANAANNNALRAFTWISSGDDTSVPSLTPLFLGAIESAPARRRDCSINQRARRRRLKILTIGTLLVAFGCRLIRSGFL